jgi:hypothetical protein
VSRVRTTAPIMTMRVDMTMCYVLSAEGDSDNHR